MLKREAAFPSSQFSPSLPRGFPSSWAQSSSAGLLDVFHIMEQVEAVQAGRTSTLLLVVPEELSTAHPIYVASRCGKNSPSEGRQGLPALLKQNSTFNSHIFSFVPCGMITRIQSAPKSPFPPAPTTLERFRGRSAFCCIALITTQHYNWYVKAY